MILEIRAVHPFFKNGYVVGCEETREAWSIDPGDEVDELLEAVETAGLQCATSCSPTRTSITSPASGARRRRLACPSGCTRPTTFSMKAWFSRGRAFGFAVEPQPPVDFFYEPEAR